MDANILNHFNWLINWLIDRKWIRIAHTLHLTDQDYKLNHYFVNQRWFDIPLFESFIQHANRWQSQTNVLLIVCQNQSFYLWFRFFIWVKWIKNSNYRKFYNYNWPCNFKSLLKEGNWCFDINNFKLTYSVCICIQNWILSNSAKILNLKR